jgi:hypothetical protein
MPMIQPDHPTDEARRQDSAWRAARARMKAAEVSQRPEPVKLVPVIRIKITEAAPEPTEVDVRNAVSMPVPVAIDRLAALQLAHTNRGPLTIEDIILLLAAVYKVDVIDILSCRRDSKCMLPRQMGYYLARKLTLHALPAIGRSFNRDHTSVLSGIRKIERLRAQDPDLDRDIRYLTAILKGEST